MYPAFRQVCSLGADVVAILFGLERCAYSLTAALRITWAYCDRFSMATVFFIVIGTIAHVTYDSVYYLFILFHFFVTSC